MDERMIKPEGMNWKKILLLCLPIVFAVSLAVTLAACMAQAGRGLNDSITEGDSTSSTVPVINNAPVEQYSEGLTYKSNGDGSCVLTGIGTCTNKTLKIPEKSPDGDTVVKIGPSAFLGCLTVDEVEFPATLTEIDDYAFYGSSVKKINVTSGVLRIGACVFAGCESLSSITVDNANPNYCSIDGVLFSNDKSRLICYPSGKTDASYTIRRGVGTIESAAFLKCAYLKEVSFNGSKSEWKNVKVGANNTSLTSLEMKFLTSDTK